MSISLPEKPSIYGFGITADNVNEALPLGLQLVRQHGRLVSSRGMETLEVPGPVTTIYRRPEQCVLFDPVRDANPFFHFFESMWILAGSQSAALPSFFLPRLKDYSDDGTVFHGAYGHRMRHAFERDQITEAILLLQNKPDTRQCVISIWHPKLDLRAETKDVPCNDMVTFKVRDGRLNMTVFNRSNDVIWGAYGANAVQFSFLLQYMAASLGLEVGHYTQVSDSYHVYTDNPLWKKYVGENYLPAGHVVKPYGNMTTPNLFLSPHDAGRAYADAMLLLDFAEANILHKAVQGPKNGLFKSYAFQEIAVPMLAAFLNYKAGDLQGAINVALRIDAWDWAAACTSWLQRRMDRRSGVQA